MALNRWAEMASRDHSSASRCPVRSLSLVIEASELSIRETSWGLLISSENTATSTSFFKATLAAMFKAKEDFPIPGRAATKIRSDLLSPESSASSPVNPEGMPVYRLSVLEFIW